jgi:nucleotide-binding universal stress UspA family protein
MADAANPRERSSSDLRTGRRGGRTAVLVVGVDGSDSSWNAFSWGCGEAERLHGRVVAVFVTSEPRALAASSGVAGADCSYSVIQDAAAEQAAQLQAEARQSIGRDVDLTFIHALGDAASELLRIAKAAHADQIVVGRSTKLRHRFTGALGRRLAGQPAAPVIVIVP